MARIYLNDFEHLNTTTQSIYELGESNVLIILMDGTNLTSWRDVKNREDVQYISEDLFGVTALAGRYKDMVNLKAIVTMGVGNIASTRDMFSGCRSLVEISSLDTWDVSLVDDISNMFKGCSSLENISALSNWNVSNVIDMSCMFMGCSALEDISALSKWDVSSVGDMHYLFADCINLKDISALSKWDVRNVRDAACLFEFCVGLDDISALKNWRLVNAFNITAMFRSCANIKDISPLSNWDLEAMTNNKSLLSIFAYCSSIKSLSPLKNWDVSNITRISGLFEGCSSIKNLSPLKKWDVSNVTSFDYLFKNCNSLTNISALKNWDISNVYSIKSMFKHCEELEDVSALKEWDVSNIKTMEGMFKQCISLADVSALSDWKLSDHVNLNYIFDECDLLEDYPLWFKFEVMRNANFDEHSRKKVLEKLDVSFFRQNNLNDFDEETQLDIVDLVSDESLLAYIVDRTDYVDVSYNALEKITDEEILAEIAIHDPNYDIFPSEDSSNPLDFKFFFYNREKSVIKIKNKVYLIRIAKESQHMLKSIKHIEKYVDTEDEWVDICLNAVSADVRLFAFDRIQFKNSFERISEESGDQVILKMAKDRIAEE